jgi:hypothetical protein
LWFGISGAAVAWVIAGLVDVLLAWQACYGGEFGSGMFTQPWFRVVLGVITLLLVLAGVLAGITSYRNWIRLSETRRLLEAEGRSREEFMALTGVFVSASLVIGMILFAIPVFLLSICQRWR